MVKGLKKKRLKKKMSVKASIRVTVDKREEIPISGYVEDVELKEVEGVKLKRRCQ